MTLPAPDPMQEDFADAKDDLLVQLVDETQPMNDGTVRIPDVAAFAQPGAPAISCDIRNSFSIFTVMSLTDCTENSQFLRCIRRSPRCA